MTVFGRTLNPQSRLFFTRFHFKLPAIVSDEEGMQLHVGHALPEVAVDLSNTVPHDCPPIFHYRVLLREAAWVQKLLVRREQLASVGTTLSILTTTADEPVELQTGVAGVRF
jgi:hypothetical protein